MIGEETARDARDAELTAYLDGELSPADSVRIGQQLASDPALAQRLDLLMQGTRPFGNAFGTLLDHAPLEQLEGRLAAALARHDRPAPNRMWARRFALAAAAVLLLAAGAVTDRVAPLFGRLSHSSGIERAERDDDWHSVVAQYLALYTPATLDDLPDPTSGSRNGLTRVGQALGLALDQDKVTLPNLALRRADLYDYDGKALAFLAYLDPASGPVALCILDKPDRSPRPKTGRTGAFTTVSWGSGGRTLMLIGQLPADRLAATAAVLAARFPPET